MENENTEPNETSKQQEGLDKFLLTHKNPDIQECYDFLTSREEINQPINFFLFADAFKKAYFLIYPLSGYYLNNEAYKFTFFNLFTHYVITQDYSITNGLNNQETNPLYIKYNIKNNNVMFSSVSDGPSSSSILQYSSLNNGDFLMADLTRTTYGNYVYQVLEQMHVVPVLL